MVGGAVVKKDRGANELDTFLSIFQKSRFLLIVFIVKRLMQKCLADPCMYSLCMATLFTSSDDAKI